VTPEQIAAHAENQVHVNKNRGEYSSAVQWENIAAAAHHLISLAARIEKKEREKL